MRHFLAAPHGRFECVAIKLHAGEGTILLQRDDVVTLHRMEQVNMELFYVTRRLIFHPH
jgi:hypothetical protein